MCVLHEHPLRLPMNIDDGRSSRFPDFPTAMSSVASWRGEACGVAWPDQRQRQLPARVGVAMRSV